MALGHGPQRAPGPDRGARGARMDQLVAKPDHAGELLALGTAGQHGLGALVHGHARDLGGAQLAADTRGAVQHGHREAVVLMAKMPRRGQPGDAPAHDHDMPPSPFHVSRRYPPPSTSRAGHGQALGRGTENVTPL